ncbi:MAG: substrate-binding domain-containing protein [Anaerolineae bacterium]|nr:substrate-binding domain-containing protein [Anaerolineae bacterium]
MPARLRGDEPFSLEKYQAVKVNNLGILLQSRQGKNILKSPFYARMIKEIKKFCEQDNIHLTFSNLPVDESGHTIDEPDVFIERQVDALLVLGLFLKENACRALDRFGVPTVLLDSSSEVKNYDAVEIANYQGAYDAVSYLINNGHRRIAIAGSLPQTFSGIFDRRRGYLDAMRDFNIKPPLFIDSPFTPADTYLAALEGLKNDPSITAVFCVSDWIAMAVMRAARELGRDLKSDLSLIGFNDTLIASHLDPALTSMHVDTKSMGWIGINLIKNRIQNPGTHLVKIGLRPDLVIRNSVHTV